MNVRVKFIASLSAGVVFGGGLWWSAVPRMIQQRAEPTNERVAVSVGRSAERDASEGHLALAANKPPPKAALPGRSLSLRSNIAANANTYEGPPLRPHEGQKEKSGGSARTLRKPYQIVLEAQQYGMRMPAFIMGLGSGSTMLSPQQQAMLKSMEADFLAMVETSAALGIPSYLPKGKEGLPLPPEEWEQARQTADSRFRLFFGDEAYNIMIREAAIDLH